MTRSPIPRPTITRSPDTRWIALACVGACAYACAADPSDESAALSGAGAAAGAIAGGVPSAVAGAAGASGAQANTTGNAAAAGSDGRAGANAAAGAAGTSAAAGVGASGAAGSSGNGEAGTGGDAGAQPCAADGCEVPGGGLTIDCAKRFHYGVNYAWSRDNFGRDFGGLAAWSGGGVASQRSQRLAELQDMRAHGVDVVRWWVFPDFRGDGVVFDGAGVPSGLGGTLAADVAAALEVAQEAGVYIEFTLFSFDAFRPDAVLDGGVQVRGIAAIATDPDARAALMEHVVAAFADEVARSEHAARMLAWDVINEPEWATSGSDGVDAAFDPMPASTIDAVPYEVMRAFIADVVTTLHAHSDRPVTVGGAAIKWARAWAGIGLDYYTFHMYDWVQQSYPYTRSLAEYGVTDRPVVLGEFPLKGLSSASYQQLVSGVFDVGYAGALGWAVTDDAQGPWSAAKANVKAFADAKGCAVRR